MTSRARQLLCESDSGLCGILPDKAGPSAPYLDKFILTSPRNDGPQVIPPTSKAHNNVDSPEAKEREQYRAERAATEKFVESIFGKLDIDGNGKLSEKELQNEQSRETLTDDERRFVDWSRKNYDIIREASGQGGSIFRFPAKSMFWRDGVTSGGLQAAAQLNQNHRYGGKSGYDWFRFNYINSTYAAEKFAIGAGVAAVGVGAAHLLPVVFPRLRYPVTIAIVGSLAASAAVEAVLDHRWNGQFDAAHGPQVTKMQNDLRQLNLQLVKPAPDVKHPKNPIQKLP